MKSRYVVALSMIAGAALGGAAIQGLHAQAKPKAYLITETEVLDRAVLDNTYFPQVRQAAKTAGGNIDFISPGENIVAVVGDAPKRVGVSEWESMEKAKAWLNSAERQALAPQREKAQKVTRQYIVEGK
jgi:uncharacterized protein (DUF1330 family)